MAIETSKPPAIAVAKQRETAASATTLRLRSVTRVCDVMEAGSASSYPDPALLPMNLPMGLPLNPQSQGLRKQLPRHVRR